MNRLKIGGLIVFVIGVVALLPFTNCSQNPQNASTPATAFMSPSQQYDALKSEFKGRVPASFCQTSEAYGCMKKIYSAQVESGEISRQAECAVLSGDLKLCPDVQTIDFNSQAAQETCRENCSETYEYMEYTCHLKIPNRENIYPIIVTAPTMEDSLDQLNRFCASIAEGAP